MSDIAVAPSVDVHLVSSILARAFAEDPVIRWLNPNPRRDVALFRTLLRSVHGPAASVDVALRSGEPVGAAVWDPPGHRLSAVRQVMSVAGFARAIPTRLGRGMALERTFVPLRPKDPHWYLGQLGAAIQGIGAGTAMLQVGIDRLDGPAYLESSNVANIPLYERFGFEVIDEVVLPHDGPCVWPMYRK